MSGKYNFQNPKYVVISCSGFYKNNTQYEKELEDDKVTGVRYDVDLWHLDRFLGTDICSSDTGDNVTYRNNQEWNQIMEIIYNINFSKYDSVIFIILTFLGNTDGGEETLVMGARSKAIKYSDIINDVKKIEGLYGKPKIFIIQADDSSLMPKRVDERMKGKPLPPREDIKQIRIPIDADRLIIKSTIPQKWARYLQDSDRKEGQDCSGTCSFLIRAFLDVLSENDSKMDSKKIDLLGLTTEINYRVKTMIMRCKDKYKSQNSDIHEKILDDFFSKMKYPTCTSTLRKQLFFPPIKPVGSETAGDERSLSENRTSRRNVSGTDKPFSQNIGTF